MSLEESLLSSISAESVGTCTMDVGGLLLVAGPGSAMIESITPAAAPSSFAGPVAFPAAAADVMGDERADEEPSVRTDVFPPEAAVAGVLALFAVPAVPVDRPRASVPVLPAPEIATAGTAAATRA